jgi:hypothetical protein
MAVSDDRRRQELAFALMTAGASGLGRGRSINEQLGLGLSAGLEAYQQGMTRARAEAAQEEQLRLRREQLAQTLQIHQMQEAGRNTRAQADRENREHLERLRVGLQQMMEDADTPQNIAQRRLLQAEISQREALAAASRQQTRAAKLKEEQDRLFLEQYRKEQATKTDTEEEEGPGLLSRALNALRGGTQTGTQIAGPVTEVPQSLSPTSEGLIRRTLPSFLEEQGLSFIPGSINKTIEGLNELGQSVYGRAEQNILDLIAPFQNLTPALTREAKKLREAEEDARQKAQRILEGTP